MDELFYQVLKNLVVYMVVSSTGGKVLRRSQCALLPTAVCPENVYSWFDAVKLAKVLTGIHESAGFPGLEELFSACCQWLSCNAFTLGHFWCHCCIPWPWKCGFWCHIICHTFGSMDHLIMRYCVDVGHLEKWRRVQIAHTANDVVMQFRDPHTSMIDFRHADKCLYSAANYSKTRAFFRPLLQHYNIKWPMGNQMVTWPMTSRERSRSWPQYS